MVVVVVSVVHVPLEADRKVKAASSWAVLLVVEGSGGGQGA